MKTFRSRFGHALAVAALLLGGAPAVQAADLPEGQVVALSERAGGRLITAYPHALYEIDARAGKTTGIPLPAPVNRISAATANGGRIYIAGGGAGVWRTDDEGRSWTARTSGLPGRDVAALASHASQDDTLYAYLPGEGIYRTEDAGGNWQLMDAGPEGITGGLIHSDMPDSMQTGWLFVATAKGVSRSMDCFCLWRNAGSLPGEAAALSFDPREPAHIYAATRDGIFRSMNGGEDWEQTGAPGFSATALAVTEAGELVAGGAGGELYLSRDAGTSWERVDGLG
jgi:photosystem II stability/assembly factor-like uncharacterized protein